MPPENPAAVRAELQRLGRLANAAWHSGQHLTEEPLRQQILVLAERLGDPPTLLVARYGLAGAWLALGRQRQALPLYIGLIDQACDPAQSRLLTDATSQWYLAATFINCVECGWSLPEVPVGQLLAILDAGLAWVVRAGLPGWEASYRLERGGLYARQQRWAVARQELEAALALRCRDPTAVGYPLANHRLALAQFLRREEVAAYAEALPLAEAVLADPEASPGQRGQAYRVLAYAHLALGAAGAAEQAAQEAHALLQSTESLRLLADSYKMWGDLYRATGRSGDAGTSAARRYRAARAHDCFVCTFDSLLDGARTRVLQARQAAGLAGSAADLPAALPATADSARIRRYLASAQRFLDRVAPLAVEWDAAAEVTAEQDSVARLRADAEALARLLAEHADA